ncbi:DUF2461 domain-containing protein [Glaciimonas immobilis]|uniref:Uncharacterized protein (TIGR02453 family) n=1 Tax=Glaciimonas immobilis TaxID=728004 RepID=A0A840RUK4_9BURK|nr:DUF2461 domain-containing protein [Glaciimonas immobilis]KAF3999745.1 DUF2461 domain-containing protein [Glaciimonas immobilis]MBB5200200.1 uncharacterized protein (TIGR02453 family) [Glaciimonas immobilis]
MHVRDLTQFLAELSENNNRAWFVMNKPRYDILRAEFLELVIHLIAEISRFDPAVAACNPKKALFRINRDMRFSHDKNPYKTTFSAAITASGLKRPSQGGGPMYYFHVNADGMLRIAAGEYIPPADRLRAIRQQIVADSSGFGKLIKNKKLLDSYDGLELGDQLVRPPKGFDGETPHLDYVRLKSFIVRREQPINKMLGDAMQAQLIASFKDAYPLVTWLRQINPSV